MSILSQQEYTAEELFHIYFSFNQAVSLGRIPFCSWRAEQGAVINPQASDTMMSLRKLKALTYRKEDNTWVADPALYAFVHPRNYNFWTVTICSDMPGECLHSYSVSSPFLGEHLTVREVKRDDKYLYSVLGLTDYRLFRNLLQRYNSPASVQSPEDDVLFWGDWLSCQPETIFWLPHVYAMPKIEAMAGRADRNPPAARFSDLESWMIQFEVFAPEGEQDLRVVKWALAARRDGETIWYKSMAN